MFAGAAREAVFSQPEVVRRVNADFVPIALKAAVVNGMLNGVNAQADDEESRLSRAIGRSKVAPQGICVVNPSGKVLDWTCLFDDDRSVVGFLDHALERFREHPGATPAFAAERYMKFPSDKLDPVEDDGTVPSIPESHPKGTACPAKPFVPRGTLTARLTGRALDAKGELASDTKSQEHYVEDRFSIFPEQEEQIANALAAASGDAPFRLPEELGRTLVAHAFLGQLDVSPFQSPNPHATSDLGRCDFAARKIGEGKLRIEGLTEVKAGNTTPRSDGALFEHEVRLSWEGYLELSGNRITRLLLSARGHEKLRWGNEGMFHEPMNDVSRLFAGRLIDQACDVRYGIVGEPAPDSETSDDAKPPFEAEARARRLQQKFAKLDQGVRVWSANGKDPAPLGRIMHEECEPLLKAGKIDEAEAVLDRVLALVASGDPGAGHAPSDHGAQDDRTRGVRERLEKIHARIRELVDQGKIDEAEKALDRALSGLGVSESRTASKEGGLIAFTLRDHEGRLQIFTARLDGSEKRQLTFDGDNGRPVWSPDGTKLLYGKIKNGRAHVVSMDQDGSHETLLVEGMAPDWSPDGKKIAFSRPDGQIWVANADGSSPAQLTTSATCKAGPSWSHDGKRMAFILIKNPGSQDDPRPQIGIMNADGSDERVLTTADRTNVKKETDGSTTVLETAHDANAPRWSPVDDRIAFWSGIENRYGQIWVIRADGTECTQLTADPSHGNSDDPSWSPDGKQIIFSTGRNHANELWVMDSDGKNERRLFPIDAAPFPGRGSWQPARK